jgi:hypothetical protein
MTGLDALIDRETAAHVAKVSRSTVAMWVSRGWVDPTTGERRHLEVAGQDWAGRHLYRYGDVLAVEQATRRTGRRRDWTAANHNNTAGLQLAS